MMPPVPSSRRCPGTALIPAVMAIKESDNLQDIKKKQKFEDNMKEKGFKIYNKLVKIMGKKGLLKDLLYLQKQLNHLSYKVKPDYKLFEKD